MSLPPPPNDQLRRSLGIPAWAVAPALVAAWLVPGLLAATETIAFWRMSGLDHPAWRAFASEAPAWLVYAALTPVVLRLAEAVPPGRRPFVPKLLVHLAFALAAGALYAAAASLCTRAFSPRVPDLSFGRLLLSWYLSSLPLVVLVWFGIVGAGRGLYWFARHREEQIGAARLSAQLAEARLGALRMQLHPHFLFNSLNALGVLVRDGDVAAAENVLELLSDLLRESLRMSGPARIPLAREVDFLRRYLEMETIRFPDRLRVSWNVPDELARARVPALILQPLVENALRHGIAPAADAGRLGISAGGDGGALVLVVEDDGVGMSPGGGGGLGLANVRERLDVLYGSAAALEVTHAPGRGTRATIRIPLDLAPESEEGERLG